MEFLRIPVKTIENTPSLWEHHWQEVATDVRRLKPHWDFYDHAERMGGLACFGAFEKGQLIAYAMFLVHPDLHASDTIMAFNDAVFMEKEYRKNGSGRAFLEYCDTELKKFGVHRIAYHVKPHVDFSRSLTERGYVNFATLYTKDLGG